MANKKIVFFEMDSWDQKYLKKNLKDFDVKFYKEKLTIDTISKAKDAEILGVFIYSSVTKEVIDKLPKLKIICTMSTGFDHIDVKYCNSKNILVSNVPFYGDNTVAEHAFALILNLTRKIHSSIHRTRSGDFSFDGLIGTDLKDKTIGLVGTGRISGYAAKIANGFGMKILGYDVIKNDNLVKDYGLQYVELDYLLKNSDVVSLHVPLNPNTKHIINGKNIKLMKHSALLINTARGGLIETEALYNAIKNNKIAGAGLDVLEEEKAIHNSKKGLKNIKEEFNKQTLKQNLALLEFHNVIVTPHNAFNSVEALQRIMNTTIENMNAYSMSKPQNSIIIK